MAKEKLADLAARSYGGKVLSAVLIIALIVVLSHHPIWSIGDDSEQYSNFSAAIISGNFFESRALADWPLDLVIRAPGYPSILAFGKIIFPNDQRLNLISSHILVLLVAYLGLATALRGRVGAPLLAVALAIACAKIGEYFTAIASEWSAFLLVLLCLALVSTCWLDRKSTSKLSLLSLVCSCAILVKPSLAYLLLLPVLLCLWQLSFKSLFKVAIGLLPVILWLSFNFWRFGIISLAPVEGYGLVFTAALVGGAAEQDFSDTLQKDFAAKYNALRPEFSEEEVKALNTIPRTIDLQKKYESAITAVFKVNSELRLDFVTLNSVTRVYALKAIEKNQHRYLSQVMAALKSMLWSLPLILLLIVSAYVVALKYQATYLLPLSIFAAIFQVANVGSTALALQVDPRYYSLGLAVVLFVATLAIFELAANLICQKRA